MSHPARPSRPSTTSTRLDEAWAEQARRRAAHRERRRRRRHQWMAVVAVLALVALAGWVLFGSGGGSGERPGATVVTPAPDGGASAATTIVVTVLPSTTIEPGSVVGLEEVWLLDRQDGSFDWGLVVVNRDDRPREDITVTARLVAADGADVASVNDLVGLLPAGSRAAVGGVVRDPAVAPVRIEAEVSIGRPSVAAIGLLAVRAVERRSAAEGAVDGAGEVVTGRLVSSPPNDVGRLRLGLLWRDEAGSVVGSMFHDVGPVRPQVDARFEIGLADAVVPDGPPTEVLVAR